MFQLFLLLTSAFAFASSDQTSPTVPNPLGPPGVEVLSFTIGPSLATHLDLKDVGLGGSRSSGLSRADDGDRARNTTVNAEKTGGIRNKPVEASMSADPFVNYRINDPIFPNAPSPERIVSESSLFAAAVIRNNGTKTIKVINWDFPHPHIRNNKPVLRYAVRSKTTIKPGEIKLIRESISRSAKSFNMVQTNGPGQSVTFTSTRDGISIRVPIASLRGGAEIIRIQYSDGSIWQRP